MDLVYHVADGKGGLGDNVVEKNHAKCGYSPSGLTHEPTIIEGDVRDITDIKEIEY